MRKTAFTALILALTPPMGRFQPKALSRLPEPV